MSLLIFSILGLLIIMFWCAGWNPFETFIHLVISSVYIAGAIANFISPPRTKFRKVYIAGPMRGYKDFNFPAFDAAEEHWSCCAWDVLNPARMDRDSGFHETNGDTAISSTLVREFAARDTKAILSADALAVLPGWENSVGAKAEVALALWIGIPVYDAWSMEKLDVGLTVHRERTVSSMRFPRQLS